jgi:hypothetical protein
MLSVAKVVPAHNVLLGPPEAAELVPSDVAADAAPTVALLADPTPTLVCCANAAVVDIIGAIAAVTANAVAKIASVMVFLFITNGSIKELFTSSAVL